MPVFDDAERERLPDHERLVLEPADLFDEASASAVTQLAAGDAAAPLRAVVNLVGGFAMGGRVHETPVEDFETQLRLNLRPAYLVCHAAVPHLLAAEGGGAIVCVSSRAALEPFSGRPATSSRRPRCSSFVDVLHAEYAARRPARQRDPAERHRHARQPSLDARRRPQPLGGAGSRSPPSCASSARTASGVVSGAHVPVYGRA